MILRRYLASILCTWLTAWLADLLVTRGHLVAALLLILVYVLAIVLTAWAIEDECERQVPSALPYRFIGASDRKLRGQDAE